MTNTSLSLRGLLHRFRLIDTWLIAPALLLVVFGELTHQPLLQDLDIDIWDKYLHFTAYFGLAMMTTIAVRADRRALWCAAGLIALGALLEVAQGLTGRDAELLDEVANTFGVVTALVLTWAGVALLRARALLDVPAA